MIPVLKDSIPENIPPRPKMSEKEAEKVIKLLFEAHGECYVCSQDLIVDFIKDFPYFEDIAKRLYKEEHNIELDMQKEF